MWIKYFFTFLYFLYTFYVYNTIILYMGYCINCNIVFLLYWIPFCCNTDAGPILILVVLVTYIEQCVTINSLLINNLKNTAAVYLYSTLVSRHFTLRLSLLHSIAF